MPRARREISTFNLSFLDIMSCGFGAVILLFLIIKHNIDVNVPVPIDTDQQASEVRLLEEEILESRENLAKSRNTISDIDDELAVAQGLAARIMEEQKETAALIDELVAGATSTDLDGIKARIKEQEQKNEQLREELAKKGEDARRIAGEGRQQYLTGLKVEGDRLLILLDASASMLDDTIVNVIRFRNMRDEVKRNARKWQKTLRIVEWLAARFPTGSKFQIYAFNTESGSVLADTTGRWLEVRDRAQLDAAVERLRTLVPENGTDLERAFASAARLQPLPDGIILITDGLPTAGPAAPRGPTITSKERLNLFNRALKALPGRVPVNVILTPLEGDPEAAPAMWRLAQATNGTFMSPSPDWP
ncbi:MAG: VWA domain-containing protein [Gammaproteobacteria bacterium]|nr:VWA domain-containing protein [Gammaproteobacteria bacterium]